MKILIIPADPTQPPRVETIEGLNAMQKAVGGNIEAAVLPHDKLSLYCNEDGKLSSLPINERATAWWEKEWNSPLRDVLVGDVFICGGVDDNGDDTDIPQSVIDGFLPQDGNSRIKI